jgi:uncharacterized protein (DUF58 family)
LDLLFAAIWTLLGTYALSRLWLSRAFRALELKQDFEDHAFAGEDVRVDLVIRNISRLPIPHLEIGESRLFRLGGGLSLPHVLSVPSRKEERLSYAWHCAERGYHEPPLLTTHIVDILGLRTRTVTTRSDRHITVYPRIVPLQRLGLPARSALATVPAQVPLLEDASRVTGVRGYQRGDSPRRIHWTATARTGQVLVKQYQPAIARETLICLDADLYHYTVQRYDAVEQAIVVAASLASHIAVQEKLPVGLSVEGRDAVSDTVQRSTLAPRAGSDQLRSILDVLARVQPSTGPDFPELVRCETERLSWGSTVVAVTGRIDESMAQTALYLKCRGYAVALIAIQPASDWRYRKKMPDLPGIPVHRVWTDRDLVRCS